ncbi:MAG TPA: D-amino-acid transaminase, partial [Halothiobacillaceae bacterium]|nr:D-amino-acid transaminase [Halothiobacillaceae bacterium]
AITKPDSQSANIARAITVADQRWARCDIKSISLLPNVLARQQAVEQGCDEAIFIKNGFALEGAATNLFAVVDGQLRTAPADGRILGGITRMLLLEMLENDPSIPVSIKALSFDELARADEVFLTSSTKDLWAVGEIDGQPVGGGGEYPGPITTKLQQRFSEYKTLKSGAETK